jgi:hypothetical protein
LKNVLQGLKKLRKKSSLRTRTAQGLKPDIHFAQLAARVNSRPDTKRFDGRLFPQPVKPQVLCGFCGTTEEAAEKVRMKSEFGQGWVGRG